MLRHQPMSGHKIGAEEKTIGIPANERILYRAGRYTEAIEALNRSRAAGSSGFPPYDLLFLAMAHHQQGRHQEAHSLFDQAVRWLAAQKSLPELRAKELAAFRAEAEAVLAGPLDDTPADVFAPLADKPQE